jgi:epoxyqueuosine reductase
MKKELVCFCNSIKIEYVGIAPPGPYHDFEKVWRKQVAKGRVSGFEEKDFKKRVDPGLTLNDVKSIIVCLFPYFTGSTGEGNLSKYVYSRDYHLIVKEKLELIAKFLSGRIKGFHYRSFVDNSPLSERYLAYKAGLGFWGINNHIITEKYGSYVFIGCILNNYPFEADKPQEKTCIQCKECVKNCPGQCISGDFTINPLKCRSYITQKKGDLSNEEKSILKKNRLVWGCDVCQDVCPHNQKVEETILGEFRENLLCSLDFEEIAGLTNKEFSKKYKERAFSWRGRSILLRNHKVINEINQV